MVFMEITFDWIADRAFLSCTQGQGEHMKKHLILTAAAVTLLVFGTGCSSDKMAQINKKHTPATYVQSTAPMTEAGLAPVAEGPAPIAERRAASPAWGDNFLVGY